MQEASEADANSRGKCIDEDDNCPCPQHAYKAKLLQNNNSVYFKKHKDNAKKELLTLQEASEADANNRGKCIDEDDKCPCPQHA